ncbi:FAD:protein FMN transferase [Ilumatobacter sp.]|uniref:FAD:protein FMN transferase n=1 Tax=Ilumatobacter sp. TaxID=1967498 RepID=UPI003AF41651
MGCDASVVVTAHDGPAPSAALARQGVHRLHELEQRWSRFIATSEISGLNRAGGEPRAVSTDTIELVESLVRAWHATDGCFDPTLLGAIVGLGYAASRDDATRRTSLPAGTASRGRPGEIVVDRNGGWVRLPVGTVLDPGGLGKGLSADLVVGELLTAGAFGVVVTVGGDLRVGGSAPDGRAWTIGVAAHADDDSRRLRIVDGGAATSTTRIRTWRRGGRRQHHLIDPSTLDSASGDVVSCTVLAGTAAWAETFTKVPFVDGLAAGIGRFEELGLAASVTTADGEHHTSTGWAEFAR